MMRFLQQLLRKHRDKKSERERPELANEFRMSVERAYDIKTRKGPVLLGKIECGTVAIGDLLVAEWSGGSSPVRVVGIEKFQQKGLGHAEAGDDDVGIELVGLTAEQAEKCRLLTSRSSKHEERSQLAPQLPPEFAGKLDELVASEYYQYVSPLLTQVAGKRIIDSQAGHSGFITFLDDNTWVASFLRDQRLEWSSGAGEPSEKARDLLYSPQCGDGSSPIPEDRPYSNEYCDIAAEVAKAHGETIESLAFGPNSFNFTFPDGHELDTMIVQASDGKPALRVFWEQW